jgi:argininosuccinate lyase
MPQKKNPDVLELVRGRTARSIGDLAALLALLKGLPLTYNRDLQEDKTALFDAVDTALTSIAVVSEGMRVLRFNRRALRAAASDPGLFATDVAEYLVVRGMPFRTAHQLVGGAVHRTQEEGRTLADLSAAEWRAMTDLAGDDIVDLFAVDTALQRREIPGGPGPRMVSRQLLRAATLVAKSRRVGSLLARHPAAAKEVGAALRSAKAPGRGAAEPRRRPGKAGS